MHSYMQQIFLIKHSFVPSFNFFFFLHSYWQAKKNIFFYLIDKIILYFPCSVLACNFCTEIKLFVCASFWVFSQNFKGKKIVPLAVFLRDNFNCSVGLVKCRSLAQILYLCIYNYIHTCFGKMLSFEKIHDWNIIIYLLFSH